MTRPRDGYHTATIQFPLEFWDDILKHADETTGGNATLALYQLIARSLGRDAPKPRRPGRPRKIAEPAAAQTPPRNRRKP
jgi:hypothetical protein